MTVYELLKAYDNKAYTDVIITEIQYDSFTDSSDYQEVAYWRSKDHNHWYHGQLNYLTRIDVNELEPYFDRTVKNFSVIGDTLNLDEIPTIYIELK